MKLLDRYLQTSILQSAAIVGLAVAALVIVAGFVSESSSLGEGHFGVLQLLMQVFLELPGRLVLVLPVIVLLGSLLALGGLAAGSELIVIRTSGVSVIRLAWSVARAGLILAAIAVLFAEVLAPMGLRLGDSLHEQAKYGRTLLESGGKDVWLREENDVVRIGHVISTKRLLDVSIYKLGHAGKLQAIVNANAARYRHGNWQLHGVVSTHVSTDGVQVDKQKIKPWAVHLQPDVLKSSIIDPEELSSRGLYQYIQYLDANDVSDTKYRIALWRNLMLPFTVFVLTLLALPFSFGSLRSAGAGQRLFIGGLVGLLFFMLNQISVSTGVVYGLPPWLAAALPTMALAVALCLWLYRSR